MAKASEQSIILCEKNILAFLYHNPEYIHKLSDEYFITEYGVSFFYALTEIRNEGALITRDKIIIAVKNIDDDFPEKEIDAVIRTVVDKNDFDFLYKNLRINFAKKNIEEDIQDTTKELLKKSDVEWNNILELGKKLSRNIALINGKQDYILSMNDLVKEYEEELERRETGDNFFTSGCEALDSTLTEGFSKGTITSIIGGSGTGKSTFAQYLINKQMNKRVPCLYVSKEMPRMSSMDRFFAQRTNLETKQFYPFEEDGILDNVKEELRKEKIRIVRNKFFRFVDHPSLTLAELEKIIIDIKLEMEVDNLIVTVDLASMVKDFNATKNKANDYEHSMNEIHRIAREVGCHFVLVFQLRRPSEKVSIKEPEDLEKFRPTIEGIKNSGAIEERSRIVIGVHYPWMQAKRYLKDSNPYLDMIEPVMEVQILKQNMGEVGTVVKYFFEPTKSKLFPVYSGDE